MNPFDQWNNQADTVDLSQWLGAQQARQGKAKLGGFQGNKKKGGRGNKYGSALISEAGGTAGAITGAGIGTAILPGLGTIAGGLIGGAIGGFGGRVAENEVRDGRAGFGDAAKEGAISGVMGAGPLRLAKVASAGIGGGAKSLVGKGGGDLAEALMSAGKAAPSVGTKIAGNAADTAATRNFRFTPTQLLNYKKKFKEDAAETIRKYGFTSTDDIEAKGIQPLQDDFNKAIDHIPDIAKSDVLGELKKRYTKLISSANLTNKKYGQELKKQAQSINQTYGDVIPASEVNNLRQSFDGLVNYTERVSNPASYAVNKRTADALRHTLQNTAERNGLVNTDGQSLKDVGRELQKLRQLSDNAERQAQLGKGSLPIGLITGGAGGAGGVIGSAAGGVGGGVGGALLGAAVPAAINSPLGRKGIMKASGAIARGSQFGDRFAQSRLGAGARVAGAGAVMGGIAGAQPQTLEDAMTQAQDQSANPYDDQYGAQDYQMSHALPGSPAATGTMQSDSTDPSAAETSPYTRDNMMADLQRDPANASKYIALYKQLQEVYAPPEGEGTQKLNSTAAGVVADTKTGLSSLEGLSAKLRENNTNGPIAGFRSLNPYDSSAKDLQANIATAKQIVGKALEGGVLRKEDEYKYAKILPTVHDTDAVAQYKIEALYQLISQRLNEYQSGINGGTGGSTLEDAITAAQGQQSYAY